MRRCCHAGNAHVVRPRLPVQKPEGSRRADLDEAVRLDPECVVARLARSRFRFDEDQTELALQDLNAASAVEPELASVLLPRAVAARDPPRLGPRQRRPQRCAWRLNRPTP